MNRLTAVACVRSFTQSKMQRTIKLVGRETASTSLTIAMEEVKRINETKTDQLEARSVVKMVVGMPVLANLILITPM